MHAPVPLGEVMRRLSIPSPARFETARQLDVLLGGAEANVAAACARLGLRTAWVSALPANPWGERIRRELSGPGADRGHGLRGGEAGGRVLCGRAGAPERALEALGRLAPKATVALLRGAAGSVV